MYLTLFAEKSFHSLLDGRVRDVLTSDVDVSYALSSAFSGAVDLKKNESANQKTEIQM